MSIAELKKALTKAKSITITVRAKPNAAQSKVLGFLADDSLKAALKAAPEDGRANLELRRLLSREFAVPIESVKISSGSASRLKTVKIISD